MVDRWEAMVIAAPWLAWEVRPGAAPAIGVTEFDLGFVLWRLPSPDEKPEIGAGRVVVDRQHGELTFWPSVPAEVVIEEYRLFRDETPVSPLTWDPLVRARHDRLRAPFPDRVTELELADGQQRLGRSMKGDGTPNLHPLVREAVASIPIGERVRGGDRCSEIAALSDLLHAEDTQRAAAARSPITAETARDHLLRGAEIESYELRDWADSGGRPSPPCLSCQSVLRHFGFGAPAGVP